MQWKKIFPKVAADTIKSTFQKYHIEISEKINFSSVNIVIGPNGAGKTRFLNALKELYAYDEDIDILYGYFPSLSDHKISSFKDNSELPECTLYDSMYMENVKFADFFKEIEAHNEEFIPELLIYHSQRQKQRGEKALNIVCESFYILTGKVLVVKNDDVFIKIEDGELQRLSVALKMLSPGELILFYMSIFLAIQQNGKNNKIIILDEPESHLHPKAMRSFIKLLTQTYEYREIWIATHSLFVVPDFQFENIVYIFNSVIPSRTSQIYQNIMLELLGDNDGKNELFFSSLEQWQYCEFITECFFKPNVVDVINPNDEQVQLFIKYLRTYHPFRVLDCGGGSGRLGLSLEAAQIKDIGNISYDIYDKSPAYTGGKFKVYKDLNEIKNTYNCVVMMNFLHEVEPQEWQALFNKIYKLMDMDSYLLFVEVSILRQGEKPNNVGYLVLGKEELEILFRDTRGLLELRDKEKQKSICILIPRKSLINISSKTIIDAIKHLRERMIKNIKFFRKEMEGDKKIDVANARYYAYLSQQYINAKLFIDETRMKDEKIVESQVQNNNKISEQKGIFAKFNPKSKRIIVKEVASLIENMKNQNKDVMLSDVFEVFNLSLTYFCRRGSIPEDMCEKCWKYIPKLERNHVDKKIIAILLVALSLMGDLRSKNKFKNNRYIKYIPKELEISTIEGFV